MIILDTSVWIEFLKNNQNFYPRIVKLMENMEIMAVECVFGELLQGVKNEEPRPKGTGYLPSPEELHSGFNTVSMRPKVISRSELLGIKPLSMNKREKEIIMDYWKYLPKENYKDIIIEAGIYSSEKKLIDHGVGLIDAMILTHGIKSNSKIWTLDKNFLTIIPAELKYIINPNVV